MPLWLLVAVVLGATSSAAGCGARGPASRSGATGAARGGPAASGASAAKAAGTHAAAAGPASSAVQVPLSATGIGVVAEAPAAARAAMRVLDGGGSAADAAVVAMLVAGVVQPVSSGLGGGGLAIYYQAASGHTTVLDFLPRAPAGLLASDLPDTLLSAAARGPLVGVPGELAGIEALHRRWGKLPRGELFAPAVRLAREGYAISHHMHRALRWNKHWVQAEAAARALFAPAGELARYGDRVQNAPLAQALEQLASEGSALFYHGQLGRQLVERVRAAGSRMVAADLEAYRVIERAPLGVDWEGVRVLLPPPPSAGGLLVAETLGMHTRAELSALGYGSGAYLHVLAETFRGAVADRVRRLGDPAFVKMDLPALLAPARLAARRASIALDRTHLPEGFGVIDGGTANVVAVDAAGNVAVVSSALGHMFGARLITPAGFALGDTLGNFTSPRARRRFGQGTVPNLAHGGARPVVSLTPALVMRGGVPALALAASGGTRIGPAVTQALLARLVFGRSPADCVSDLRIQAPPGGGLGLEPRAPADLRADLRRRGEVVLAGTPDYSGVSLVLIAPAPGGRRVTAAADPRKGGLGLAR